MGRSITKDRLASFSDGIFAVIITIMVLQVRVPPHPTFADLLTEWPTILSYMVSYLLIVIMWINHHFLWTFAKESSARLVFWNFAHTFCASLVPFATAWVAGSRISAVPAFVYAGVIVLVNLSYHGFAYAAVHRSSTADAERLLRRAALARSTLTLVLFTTAMLLSLKFPLVGFALVTCVLLTYARPQSSTRFLTRAGQRS
jgi:uncharacterized membrane protein